MIFEKIDVRQIVKGHISTFYDFRSRSHSFTDDILFIFAPAAISTALALKGLLFSVSALNAVLTAFSIFAGLLFNLLVMVLTFLQSSQGKGIDDNINKKKKILREITANLCFAILTAIFISAVSIVMLSITTKDQTYLDRYSSGILSFGAINFGLTLLMILKRMYALMQYEFDQHKMSKVA